LPARVRARQRACLRGWLLCAFVCVLSGGPRGSEFFFPMSASDELKARGNEAFKASRWDEAIGHFSAAIEVDASNHVLYSNRSAAHASKGDFASALEDAEKCVGLKADWAKGWGRKGAALAGLRRWTEALDAYEGGLKVEPGNAVCVEGLENTKRALASEFRPRDNGLGQVAGLFAAPDALQKLAANPKTVGFLAQPDFMAKVEEIRRDPATVGTHFMDPRIMQCMTVLMGLPEAPPAAGEGGGKKADFKVYEEDEKRKESKPQEEVKEAVPEEEEELDEEQLAKRQKRERAQAKKQEGNAFYKAKKFEEALSCYEDARTEDPEDPTFELNRAAVYLEMGRAEDALRECESGVSKAQEFRSDYTVVAKLLSRKGVALTKMSPPKWEEAVAVFKKSLMENRIADTLKKLQDAEKGLKEAAARAAYDPAKALQLKEEGNALFKAQDFPAAVKKYTESVVCNPEDHTVYSNRAACYTKLTAFSDGLKDVETCLKLNPTFAKAYSRRATIEFFLREYDKALLSYEEGLKLDPDSAEMKEGVQRVLLKKRQLEMGQGTEEELNDHARKQQEDPEVQMIMMDPVMRNVLNDLQTNPASAQKHMANPDIAKKIQRLISAGIIRTG